MVFQSYLIQKIREPLRDESEVPPLVADGDLESGGDEGNGDGSRGRNRDGGRDEG